WDGSQGSTGTYTNRGVIDNNISVFNGGRGVEVFQNITGGSAHIFIRHNTTYGNETDPNQSSVVGCSEITTWSSYTTEVFANLTQSTAATGCGGNTIYNYFVENGN